MIASQRIRIQRLRLFALAASTWFITTSALCANSPDQRLTISLDLSLRNLTASNCTIAVSLLNRQTNAFSMYLSDLPWSTRHSILLVPVLLSPDHTSLQEELFIDDPSPGQIVLPARGILTGEIRLDRRFPSILSALHASDIILFWSYQPEAIGSPRLGRVGGWLHIPGLLTPESGRPHSGPPAAGRKTGGKRE